MDKLEQVQYLIMFLNNFIFSVGKTFTMEGGVKRSASVSWDEDPTSGIIPRALAQILDNLKVIILNISVLTFILLV